MDLDTYLKQPGAMPATELARRVGVGYDQLRQWRKRHKNRYPQPENCVAIEQATAGAVTRRDLRPHDWHRIWPELRPQAQPKARKKGVGEHAAASSPAADACPPTQSDIDRITHGAAQPESARQERPSRVPADAPAGPTLMYGDRRVGSSGPNRGRRSADRCSTTNRER